jgi:hypothetical protein
MFIDFQNAVTLNISKMWEGHLEDGTSFTINGGWNDWDGYYVESVELKDFEGDNEEEIIEEITESFLKEVKS